MDKGKKKHVNIADSILTSQPRPPGLSASAIRDSVCRIRRYGKTFDWTQPYNDNIPTPPSTGTGFIMKELQVKGEKSLYLMTAYHVVEYAQRIMTQIESVTAEPIASELVVYDPFLDVAIIRVPMDSDLPTNSLETGESDNVAPNDQVQAVGFAMGEDRCQFTTGYVSGRTKDKIQIDAAVNGGNSGGPLVHIQTGKVIGVITSGYNPSDAQNINYACPIFEALKSLKNRGNGKEPHVSYAPSFNASFDSSCMTLVRSLQCDKGCYVKHVVEGSPLHKGGMREGDLLQKINDFDVDVQARISSPWWTADSLDIKCILSRIEKEEKISFTFFSMETKKSTRISCILKPSMYTFRLLDHASESVPFCFRGGVVVQPPQLESSSIQTQLPVSLQHDHAESTEKI